MFLLLSVGLHFLFPIGRIVHSPYTYAGIVFVVLGIVLNLWSDSLFKKARTTVKPYENPAELITSGPFRISRHPMYLGMVAILLGVAVLLGSIIAFWFPALFLLVMELMFIPLEEKKLEELFGESYLNYRKKARRWI